MNLGVAFLIALLVFTPLGAILICTIIWVSKGMPKQSISVKSKNKTDETNKDSK